MSRFLLTAGLLLGFPAGVFAQLRTSGGAPRTGESHPSPPTPGPPKYRCGDGVVGGFCPPVPTHPTHPTHPSRPTTPVYGFNGLDECNAYSAYSYNYGARYGYAPTASFAFGGPSYVVDYQPAPVPVIGYSAPAVLTLEFPAPAELWVNGKKGDGKPTTEWVLTSPTLNSNTAYLFEVTARWTIGGKTYESERAVPVMSGNRSRALVVGGREIKE
ncbi:MAG: hypothetical protein K8U57_34680 [Planctomycetes bacterium]|nr:hypothetical protein [Planctomycetota bacterium]